MPEMTGYQFLERLHDDATGNDPAYANVPVIVLTSAILEPGERILLRNASRILSKSDLSSPMLIDTIEDVLAQAQPTLAE
jgi:CheY-like chemotaxis protein